MTSYDWLHKSCRDEHYLCYPCGMVHPDQFNYRREALCQNLKERKSLIFSDDSAEELTFLELKDYNHGESEHTCTIKINHCYGTRGNMKKEKNHYIAHTLAGLQEHTCRRKFDIVEHLRWDRKDPKTRYV